MCEALFLEAEISGGCPVIRDVEAWRGCVLEGPTRKPGINKTYSLACTR